MWKRSSNWFFWGNRKRLIDSAKKMHKEQKQNLLLPPWQQGSFRSLTLDAKIKHIMRQKTQFYLSDSQDCLEIHLNALNCCCCCNVIWCWWWWSGASLCFIPSTFSWGPLSKISIWWSHNLFSPTSMTREKCENLRSQVILIRVFLIILQLRPVCTIYYFLFFTFTLVTEY